MSIDHIFQYSFIHGLRSGVIVPPVPVCRLLLVLDYMLFQFSELDPELVKQVGQNHSQLIAWAAQSITLINLRLHRICCRMVVRVACLP